MRISLSLSSRTSVHAAETRGDAENPRRSLPQPPVSSTKALRMRCDSSGFALPLLGQLIGCSVLAVAEIAKATDPRPGDSFAIFCVESSHRSRDSGRWTVHRTWSMFCREAAARSDRPLIGPSAAARVRNGFKDFPRIRRVQDFAATVVRGALPPICPRSLDRTDVD